MNKRKAARKTTLLLLALLALSFFSLSIKTASAATDPPIHIHLTWQSSDMATTMTITWQTNTATSGDTVRYDNISRNGDPLAYRYSTNGTHHTYSGASGWIHDVELVGLSQNTTYYFVCGGDTGGYSVERKFKTASSNLATLRFVAGGDCRDNPSERDVISTAMRAYNPSFVLFSGDNVADGTIQSLWDDWFASEDSLWIDSSGYTIPIVPVLGNHEGEALNWFQQFALPGVKNYYSLDWGKDVHIIVLDTDIDLSGAQLTWLRNDLEAHKNVEWKIAVTHSPAFSSSYHGSDPGVQQFWVPEFDKYHVNVVIAGHDHCYERSNPVNATRSGGSSQSSYTVGTMYVTSGGWGAPLYPVSSNWWTAYSESNYNFVLVGISSDGILNLQAKDDTGRTFDSVQTPSATPPVIPEFPETVILATLLVIASTVSAVGLKGKRLQTDPRNKL